MYHTQWSEWHYHMLIKADTFCLRNPRWCNVSTHPVSHMSLSLHAITVTGVYLSVQFNTGYLMHMNELHLKTKYICEVHYNTLHTTVSCFVSLETQPALWRCWIQTSWWGWDRDTAAGWRPIMDSRQLPDWLHYHGDHRGPCLISHDELASRSTSKEVRQGLANSSLQTLTTILLLYHHLIFAPTSLLIWWEKKSVLQMQNYSHIQSEWKE